MTLDRHGAYFDEDVAPLVLDIIVKAKRYVFLVSPRVKLWREADMTLTAALRRGVEVTVVVRDGENPADSDQVKWLLQQGALVFATGGLHSKVYFNESLTVVRSMNILAGAPRSLEIAMTVSNQGEGKKVRDYAHNWLIPTSTRIRSPRDLINGPPVQVAPRAVPPRLTAAAASIAARRCPWRRPPRCARSARPPGRSGRTRTTRRATATRAACRRGSPTAGMLCIRCVS